MNVYDFLVVGAVAIWFTVSFVIAFRKRKKGGCCGSCSGCSGCCKRSLEKTGK